jgi:hypothetical protein
MHAKITKFIRRHENRWYALPVLALVSTLVVLPIVETTGWDSCRRTGDHAHRATRWSWSSLACEIVTDDGTWTTVGSPDAPVIYPTFVR